MTLGWQWRAMAQIDVRADACGRRAAANEPAPVPLWAGGAPGALGTADDDMPTIAAYHAGVESDEDGGGDCAGRGVSAPFDGEGRVGRGAVAERAWGGGVCAEVPAGAEVSQSDGAGGCAAGDPDGAGEGGESMGLRRTTSGCGGFRRAGTWRRSAGTKFDAGNASATDAIEQQSSRPDFLILAYPVITMLDPYVHAGSRKYLLGDTPDPAQVEDDVGRAACDERRRRRRFCFRRRTTRRCR